ncbi:MAG: DNA mismatch repair protein MutS [Firmicutes bacterium]|nr:DNA mismatch repair protein MutS [Bacillota bacterium]
MTTEQKLSPMMTHYVHLKESYADSLLFYRLGDFYELFFEDAIIASRELGLTLTGRGKDNEETNTKRIDMCGVPHHAVGNYIKRLVDRGYSVAICEQLSLPQKGKKMVDRDVVRVVTPGTFDDEGFLDQTKNNFVAAVYFVKKEKLGSISWADITTGEFFSMEVEPGEFIDVLAMINPREIISTIDFKTFLGDQNESHLIHSVGRVSSHYDYAFNPMSAHEAILSYFKIKSTTVFDFDFGSQITPSAGALLEYLMHTQKRALKNIAKIQVVKNNDFMILDKVARDHLELTNQYRDQNNKVGSLLWVLDDTQTPMGARLLVSMLGKPLQDVARINQRLDAVEQLANDSVSSEKIRDTLSKMNDLSRMCGKIAMRSILPREMQGLAKSLRKIEDLKQSLGVFQKGLLKNSYDALTPLPNITDLVDRAIADNLPTKLEEGGYIRDGYDATLDELRDISKHGESLISNLESSERKACEMKEIKIGYNRITGYFFEVPKRLSAQVPYRMNRIATTKDTERYTTEELKNLETKLLGAQDSAKELEAKILSEIRDLLIEYIPIIQSNSNQVAIIDVISTFASVAVSSNWIRPKLNNDGEINIKSVRHPVIEKIIGSNRFVANDCYLKSGKTTTKIITGPNMAGKSTYMRSIALTVLLSHIGSFVPASSANIALTDRIFTRIGASDSLITGQSTFMIELNQICTLLHNATKSSLLLIDELGRGTGTQEGKAIASATISYVTDKIGCMAMFATHFHELAALAEENSKIKNYRATTSVVDGNIVFLHKILPGKEEHSFGIEVAKMAGLPKEVLENAKKLYEIDKATQQQLSGKNVGPLIMEKEVLIENPVVSKLQEININNLSPMEALVMLGDLVKESKND